MNRERQYVDLILELRDLDAETDTFTVAILFSPVGETREPDSVRYEFEDLKSALDSLEKKDITQERLIELGEKLAARMLPPGKIRELFNQAVSKAGQDGGVRLRLLVREPRLAQLPWEFCYLQQHNGEKDRRHFLVLNPQISMVRHEALETAHPSVTAARPDRVRLVAATANVEGFSELELRRERRVIEKALKNLPVDGLAIEYEPFIENATFEDLKLALAGKADLFHFAGHGSFKEDTNAASSGEAIGAGYIVVATDKESREPYFLPAGELAAQLQMAGVRVAMLGACESGRRDGVSAWTGVAAALVEGGIPAVVAMQYEIFDAHAIAFSRMFYASLALGLSIDEAVAAGRLSMLGESEADEVEWGVPVLYMRAAGGHIFPDLSEKHSGASDQIRHKVEQTVETLERGGELIGIEAEWVNGLFEVHQETKNLKGKQVGIRLTGQKETRADEVEDD
jgi:hypothetical protein